MNKTLPLLLVLFLSGPAAAQDLPPDVLADKLLLEAGAALASGDPQHASRTLREIEALDVEPPPMFAYVKGRVLVEHGDGPESWREGRLLLARFAVAVGRDSEHYTPALNGIVAAEDRMKAAARLVRLEGRLPEILRDASGRMVRVEGGTFAMGCTPEQEHCGAGEKPTRPVQIESFEIDRFEVTQVLWEAVMGENPSAFEDCPTCPVETVSWDDVQAFLHRLNANGDQYRLPSEAEWEYAARGGQQTGGYQYAGSGSLAEVAWYYENSGNRTQPTGRKQPNELGLFDMSGNTREWVQDCWHGNYDGAPGDGSAREEGDCSRRVVRGGSWDGKPNDVRAANRDWYTTGFRNNNLGFRIARNLPE